MAERYTRVYSIEKDLYTEGVPIVIKAGALLLDNKNNNIIAQLKFQNIGRKKIKAITVGIIPLDVAGDPNGEEVLFQYLDMLQDRDDVFGDQTPIIMPDNTTRGFQAYVKSVVYEDNHREVFHDSKWEKIPVQDTLLNLFGDEYTLKQFSKEYQTDFKLVPIRFKDIWLCGCNAINCQSEERCHICKFKYDAFLSVNTDELKRKGEEAKAYVERIQYEKQKEAERLKREQEEKQIREEQERKEIREAIQKRNKRLAVKLIATALVLGIVFWGTKYLPYSVTKYKAQKAYETGNYGKAVKLYESINKDNQFDKKINEINYNEGLDLMEGGDYEGAIEVFQKSSDYKDSKDKIDECNKEINLQSFNEALKNNDYETALSYIGDLPDDSIELSEEDKEAFYNLAKEKTDSGNYNTAVECLQIIGDYKDAKSEYSNVSNYSDALFDLKYGKLETAKEKLSLIDADYKETSTLLSLIDQYSIYDHNWTCYWAQGKSANGKIYGENDDRTKYNLWTEIIISEEGSNLFICEGKETRFSKHELNVEGSMLTWQEEDISGRVIADNTFDTLIGQRERVSYNNDGSVYFTSTFKYTEQ